MLLSVEIFGLAMSHGDEFPNLCETSSSAIVHCFPLNSNVAITLNSERLDHTVRFVFHRILFCCCVTTRKIIKESENLKGVVRNLSHRSADADIETH